MAVDEPAENPAMSDPGCGVNDLRRRCSERVTQQGDEPLEVHRDPTLLHDRSVDFDQLPTDKQRTVTWTNNSPHIG